MEGSDCWTEFTKWSYSSFAQYLTIAEKERIFLHSWIPGCAGYYLLLAWRVLGGLVLLFFWLDKTYSDDKVYGFGSGFKYLTNWGYTLTTLHYILFLAHYGVKFCRRGNA